MGKIFQPLDGYVVGRFHCVCARPVCQKGEDKGPWKMFGPATDGK